MGACCLRSSSDTSHTRDALPRSELLDQLDAAPIQVRCFGAREVRHVPNGEVMYRQAAGTSLLSCCS
jgi:hypothetical protein